jgi:hypothetical protein
MFQMYKMSAAAPETIVLTVADPALKSDLSILNHKFTSLGGHFDSSLCITPVPFIIHPNNRHVLITDLDQIFRATIHNKSPDGQRNTLSVNEEQSPLRLCYSVCLKSPDMMLHVGRNASLSLLLRSGCLQVTPLMVTSEQATQLMGSTAAADEQNNRTKWIPVRPPTPCPSPINAQCFSDDNDDDDDDDNNNDDNNDM